MLPGIGSISCTPLPVMLNRPSRAACGRVVVLSHGNAKPRVKRLGPQFQTQGAVLDDALATQRPANGGVRRAETNALASWRVDRNFHVW